MSSRSKQALDWLEAYRGEISSDFEGCESALTSRFLVVTQHGEAYCWLETYATTGKALAAIGAYAFDTDWGVIALVDLDTGRKIKTEPQPARLRGTR